MKPTREPDGQWSSMQDWINHATRDIGGMNAACYDIKCRRCLIGKDFRIADEENAYPVSYWFGEGGETAKEQKESKRKAEAALRLQYPWRYK